MLILYSRCRRCMVKCRWLQGNTRMHRSGIRVSDRISLFSGDTRRRQEDTTGRAINIVDLVVKGTESKYVD